MDAESQRVWDLVRERARLKRRIYEIDQELCKHNGETYRSMDWTYDHTCCSKCHKVLINHRVRSSPQLSDKLPL